MWVSDAPWAASNARAGCSCPAATASPPAHAPRDGNAAGCASGRRGDGGQPWRCESWVEQGERVGGGVRRGEAAAVEVEEDWGSSGWRSEGREQTRRKKKTKRSMTMAGTCR